MKTLEWIIVGALIAIAIFSLIKIFLPVRRAPCRGCPAASLCKKNTRRPTCEKNR